MLLGGDDRQAAWQGRGVADTWIHYTNQYTARQLSTAKHYSRQFKR